MKVDSVQKQLKIFLTMLDADKPLRLTEISNLCRMSPQLTKYHIPNMVKDGLIVPIDIDGERYYSVQLVFLNTSLFDKLSTKIVPIIKIIADNVSYEYSEGSKEDVIRNCLISYIIAVSRHLNGQ